MSAQHTPGPWTVQTPEKRKNGYENWNTYCVRSSRNVHLATVGHVDRFHEDDHEANARLIAAAPELLAALELIYSNAAESPEWIRDRISLAIAKAKGEGEA